MELSLKDAVRQMDKKDKLVVLMHYPPFNSYEELEKILYKNALKVFLKK